MTVPSDRPTAVVASRNRAARISLARSFTSSTLPRSSRRFFALRLIHMFRQRTVIFCRGAEFRQAIIQAGHDVGLGPWRRAGESVPEPDVQGRAGLVPPPVGSFNGSLPARVASPDQSSVDTTR